MSGFEILTPDSAPFFVYGRSLVTANEAGALLGFLDDVPERNAGEVDAGSEFVLVRHSAEDGARGRSEAAAGDPVWLGTDWGRGVPIPPELVFLRNRVGDVARAIDFPRLLGFGPNLFFSSTYVDRYLPGGGFFPHTDGARYGAVIAGVSIGPGSAEFVLWKGSHEHSSPVVVFTLEPNSMYFFCGPIRHSPWRHAIRSVTDLRYGITWRTLPES